MYLIIIMKRQMKKVSLVCSILQEVDIMNRLRSAFVVQYLGACIKVYLPVSMPCPAPFQCRVTCTLVFMPVAPRYISTS